MARRSDVARRLAEMLTDEAGVPVEVEWQRTTGQRAAGQWVFTWMDGPTQAPLQERAGELVAELAGLLAPLRKAQLGWQRLLSDRAIALAVLDLAREGLLPADPRERQRAASGLQWDLEHLPYPTDRDVQALIAADVLNEAAGGLGNAHAMADLLAVERDLAGRGIADWPAPAAAGAQLRGRWVWGAWSVPGSGVGIIESRPRAIAEPVTEPGNGKPAGACPVCGGPVPAPAGRGRPARYCSPRCRLRAHRAARAAAQQKTEQRNETVGCAVCGEPVQRAGTGRPGRYCSPRCRRKAWKTRTALARD